MVGMLQEQLYNTHMITKYQLAKPSIVIFVSYTFICNQMVIPAEVHEWYNTLPTSARAVDTPPAPSIDDSGDDGDDALI